VGTSIFLGEDELDAGQEIGGVLCEAPFDLGKRF
jgi:hypothetical protein